MKIAVDAMGGDHAPEHPINGALLAARELNAEVVLVGDEPRLVRALGDRGAGLAIEIVHAEQAIGMDESPATAVRRKRKSSIHVAARLLRDGEVDGIVSAGNTGAVMAVSKVIVGTLVGVDRPALAVVLPSKTGRVVLIDVGANIAPKSSQLLQFAAMGHHFAREILAIDRPRVGLLSIGEEELKGNDLIRGAHKLLRDAPIDFCGNVEAGDLYRGVADVVVSDGFTGNIVLKTSEAAVDALRFLLREELGSSIAGRLGALLARGSFKSFARRVDYAEFGGAPLLGLKGLCVICHGRSNPRAIRSGVRVALEYRRHQVNERIEDLLAQTGRTADHDVVDQAGALDSVDEIRPNGPEVVAASTAGSDEA